MLLVEKNTGGLESYQIDESRLKSNFKNKNGVLFHKNDLIEIIVSQNHANRGQNLKIKEN